MEKIKGQYAQILYEYLSLNYSTLNLESPTNKLKDLYLGPYILFRDYGSETTISYLYCSDKIIIPNEYFRMFVSFDIIEGNRLSHLINLETEGVNEYDKFIKEFVIFVRFIQNKLTYSGESESLVKLLDICEIGTKGIRVFLKEHLDIELPPWSFENLLEEIEI